MASWTNATAAPPAVGLLRPEVNDALSPRPHRAGARRWTPWVEHYWTVAWELDEPGFVAEVVVAPVGARDRRDRQPRHGSATALPAGLVHGVVTRQVQPARSRGTGRVFGVKFRPGGFGAFTGADVGAWTDRVVPAARRRSASWPSELVRDVLALETDRARADAVDGFLLDRVPGRDERYDEVLAIVRDIQDDPALTSVELAARRYACRCGPAAAVPPLRRRRPEVGAAAGPAARRRDPDRRAARPTTWPRSPSSSAGSTRPTSPATSPPWSASHLRRTPPGDAPLSAGRCPG